jgi:hypothetical protein
MSKENAPSPQGDHPADVLPREHDSPSEILAASHLFTAQVLDASPTPWARGDDGLEHREMRMKLRLLERFKGPLRAKPGEDFDLTVPQRRENASAISDYHGFWSHIDIEKGTKWLVISRGEGSDPASLMREPAIMAIMDASYAVDVAGAITAEERFGASFKPGADFPQRRMAAVGLLRLARDKESEYRGLFGRYVWARCAPIYAEVEKAISVSALQVIAAKEANPELRQAFIAGMYDQVLSLGPTRDRRIELGGALLRLLEQPEAATLVDWLAQVPIYNLVLGPEAPVMEPTQFVSDPAARGRIAHVLAGLHSQRAKQLQAWLESKNP